MKNAHDKGRYNLGLRFYTEADSKSASDLGEFGGPFSDHFFLDPISLRIVIEEKASENAHPKSPVFSHFELAWVYTEADSICKNLGEFDGLFWAIFLRVLSTCRIITREKNCPK